MSERLLTVGDVAEMCQVHRKTVTRAIRAGRLRAVRLGTRGAYRVRQDDVERWLVESAVEPARNVPAGAGVPGMLRLDGRSGRLT
jgi:excisionase family DNA binding protein